MTLLPEYRAQLYDAAQRRARRPVMRTAGWWPVAVSTAVAVGVVAVAVVAPSHRQASSAPAHATSTSPKQQLLDMLGVLRRPQTEADRQTWLPGYLRRHGRGSCPRELPCAFTVDRPLVRTVSAAGSRYRVGILPLTSPTGAAAVALTLDGPGVYHAAGPPSGLPGLHTRGVLVSAYVSNGINHGVFAVPDGVARVVIGPVHLLDPTITSGFAPTPGAIADVRDNVAVFQLSGLTEQNLKLHPRALGRYFSRGSGRGCRVTVAIYALPATAPVIWFAADGRLVNHVRINFPVYVGTHHPAAGTTRNPTCAASG